MSIWLVDGETPHNDVRDQRLAAGTVGGEHATPGSFGSKASAAAVGPFDKRVSYTGTWSLQVGADGTDFLGESASSSLAGSTVSYNFTGTSIAILGMTRFEGGRADIYIDGVPQAGSVNTFTYLSAAYALAGLNGTDTTINVASTTGFSSTGSVVIDSEVIAYTGITATSFTGCTRVGNATHTTGSTVTAYSSSVEFYSDFRQSRVTVWSNNRLNPGNHTVTVVVRPDANASSSGHLVYVNCFVTTGLVGAGNIITHYDYIKVPGVAFDGTGYGAVPTSLTAGTTAQQVLGIVGAACYSGTSFAGPCFVSWRGDNSTMYFYNPLSPGFTFDVVITVIVLGASI